MRVRNRETTFALRMLSCFSLMLIAVTAVLGQGPTRSFDVSGVVLDPNGAVIGDAKITLRREGRSLDGESKRRVPVYADRKRRLRDRGAKRWIQADHDSSHGWSEIVVPA